MCDCSTCNMSKEEQDGWAEAYLEWEYKKYCESTEKPLSIDEWLKQYESPIQD